MNFSEFLIIVRARYKIILLTLILTVATALTLSLLQPNTYKATATLVLNFKGIDPVTGLTLPAQLMPGYMATQVDIIKSRNVALKVVDDLKLTQGAEVEQQFYQGTKGQGTIRDWLAGLLLRNLDVVPSRESSVLDISFQSADPQFAAASANAFAAAYQKTDIQLRGEPLKKASTYFNDQIKVLRNEVEAAQRKLSTYQQENGLFSADTRLDVESARLNELSSQLVMAQGQLAEASSRRKEALRGNGESPDILGNGLVQTLKTDLARAEAKFSQVSQNLGSNHPLYQASKAEVDKLRADLNSNIRATSNGVVNAERIMQQRTADMRAALEAQKEKVLHLNRARDELAVLIKDADAAQRAYDTAAQRFMQTSLEGQANQTDVAVLNPAIEPLAPFGPKVLLNTVLAVFLGGVLGLGFGVLAEMADRRVRSSHQLVETLQIPVLGAIEWRRRKRRRFGWPALSGPQGLPSH
jgi:succinoglycan biosynthesis transport protein ExoP